MREQGTGPIRLDGCCLLSTIKADVDPRICVSGGSLPGAVTLSQPGMGFPNNSSLYQAGDVVGAVWQNGSVAEKLEIKPTGSEDL